MRGEVGKKGEGREEKVNAVSSPPALAPAKWYTVVVHSPTHSPTLQTLTHTHPHPHSTQTHKK